ncbi:hypothetical protein ACFW1A_13540 [Kitasatospora sp. NPDC058965]|uniref:hypothetical protein n=1 Tax=Kitasatospora sp. NPDC058965 TaxID=3346682 RepID=UPI0036BC4F5F
MSPTRMASEHRWIYIGSIVLLVGLVIGALLTYTQQKATNEAHAKAQKLNDALVAQGFPALNTHNIALVLGTDGGVVCTDPNSALKQGLWRIQLASGAGGPGMRPIIADGRILEAGAEVIKVYCPDQLAGYQEQLNTLKTSDVVND